MADDPCIVPPTESARSVFVAWEKRRLIYNGVLALIVVVFAGRDLTDIDFHVYLAFAVLGANVCFCAGPVAEGYLILLGLERWRARELVFMLGMLLAGLLTGLAVLNWAPVCM